MPDYGDNWDGQSVTKNWNTGGGKAVAPMPTGRSHGRGGGPAEAATPDAAEYDRSLRERLGTNTKGSKGTNTRSFFGD